MVNIKADRIRNAASLIKPLVMLTVYDIAFQNKLCLTDSIEKHIYKMITVSNNGFPNSLIRLVGDGDTVRGWGRLMLLSGNTVSGTPILWKQFLKAAGPTATGHLPMT